MLADQRQQRVGVPRPADDLVARVLEQAGEALAQQHGVLGDHDAHGSSTAIRVPAPGGLSIASVPPWAATRSAMPGRPIPPPSGAADAVVGDEHPQHAVLARGLDHHARRRRVLDRVGERLAGDEVRGRLDLGWRAVGGRADLDRHGGAARQVGQRGAQAFVEPRRAHAGGDRAQIGDRGGDLVDGGVERGDDASRRAGASAAAGAARCRA